MAKKTTKKTVEKAATPPVCKKCGSVMPKSGCVSCGGKVKLLG